MLHYGDRDNVQVKQCDGDDGYVHDDLVDLGVVDDDSYVVAYAHGLVAAVDHEDDAGVEGAA